MNEQAVTETETEAKPLVEETDAQEQLDKLLNQYESETKPAETAKPSEEDVVKQWATRQMAKEQEDEINSAIGNSATMLKESLGDLGKNMPDYIAEGIIHAEGRKNPAIVQAFQDRGSNPAKWNEIVQTLGKKVAKDLQPKDDSATESWAAVESAVHSASTSTQQESEPDFAAMSDQEFQMWKIKHG